MGTTEVREYHLDTIEQAINLTTTCIQRSYGFWRHGPGEVRDLKVLLQRLDKLADEIRRRG